MIENFITRRFICNVPTFGLNRVFVRLYPAARKQAGLSGGDFVNCLRSALQTQNYPTDLEFEEGLKVAVLYGGNRSARGRLILEAIERSFGHKELVALDDISVEHVMPQKLTEEWKQMLGEDAESDHDLLKHTIGNLTLTGYNSEMSNAPFHFKKSHYLDSKFELNKYFSDIDLWNRHAIEDRTHHLTRIALKVWPYFGDASLARRKTSKFTGSKPVSLRIFGEELVVKTWRDVLETTLNAVYNHKPEKFGILRDNLELISDSSHSFRSPRELKSGDYVETNLSAQRIYEMCIRAIGIAGGDQSDWEIRVE